MTDIDESSLAISMAEGEMEVGGFRTKGFRLYSLILLALLGFLGAVWIDSPQVNSVMTVLVFLLGVFTGKKV